MKRRRRDRSAESSDEDDDFEGDYDDGDDPSSEEEEVGRRRKRRRAGPTHRREWRRTRDDGDEPTWEADPDDRADAPSRKRRAPGEIPREFAGIPPPVPGRDPPLPLARPACRGALRYLEDERALIQRKLLASEYARTESGISAATFLGIEFPLNPVDAFTISDDGVMGTGRAELAARTYC